MLPAQQCFHPGDAPAVQIALRLIAKPKFLLLESTPQTGFQRQALERIDVEGLSE